METYGYLERGWRNLMSPLARCCDTLGPIPDAVSANMETPVDKRPEPGDTVRQPNPAEYPGRAPTAGDINETAARRQ